MSRNRIGTLLCAKAGAAASVAVKASTMRIVSLLSLGESLAHQPILNYLGDLIAVPVLHHHVRIALDADVWQVDPVRGAACGFDGIAISHVGLLERRPARVLIDVVAEDLQHRHVLELAGMGDVAGRSGLGDNDPLDLVGALLGDLEAEGAALPVQQNHRSEERRVGKEGRTRWSEYDV